MTSTAAILASDFSDSTADTNRRTWQVGYLQHVIAALDGAPVAITTSRQSGHTLVGVTLVRAFDGGPSRGPRVTVEYEDGSQTNFFLPEVGEAIIPLTDRTIGGGAKWIALRSVREQVSAAIQTARAEHGEVEGRAWGRWKGTPLDLHTVSVSYTPHTGNPAFAEKWGTPWWGRVAAPADAAKANID